MSTSFCCYCVKSVPATRYSYSFSYVNSDINILIGLLSLTSSDNFLHEEGTFVTQHEMQC